MYRSLLFMSLALGVSCYPYGSIHAQGYPPGYGPPGAPPPPPPGAYSPPPPPAYPAGPAYAGENCGTPDEPKPCPPLPRHPLPYYPANRP